MESGGGLPSKSTNLARGTHRPGQTVPNPRADDRRRGDRQDTHHEELLVDPLSGLGLTVVHIAEGRARHPNPSPDIQIKSESNRGLPDPVYVSPVDFGAIIVVSGGGDADGLSELSV